MNLTIKLRGKTYSAPTIEAASDLFNAKQEIRGRIIREALVMDGSEVVARISQNGNVWPPQEWFPGMQPLIRAPLTLPPGSHSPCEPHRKIRPSGETKNEQF